MICWGSWANTQKIVEKKWRFEYFYLDYSLGVLLTATIFAFSLGSFGESGRSFIDDLTQANSENILRTLAGGVVFNAANILLVVAIAFAGMSVAFPVGIGIALIVGVFVNYLIKSQGNPYWLACGVLFIIIAIVLDALAYKKKMQHKNKVSTKGLALSVIAGFLMSAFYGLVAKSLVSDFSNPESGFLTPYSAIFIFAIGIVISSLIFVPYLMKKPIDGEAIRLKSYFQGRFSLHTVGILGGAIWCVGMVFNIIASGEAGFAISYGLGQGATLVAALWGVFIWKEFDQVKGVKSLIVLMFIFFVLGISMVIKAGV